MTWYEDDVRDVINVREHCTYAPETIFYGSSTIRLWSTLYEDFAVYKPVNLGFGGSTLAACTWFFDSIVSPIANPKRLILYAGDNDLGDGRRAEEVLLFYRALKIKLRERYNDIPFYFVSIKPSIEREDILDEIKRTNVLIAEDIGRGQGNDCFINVYDHMINSKGKPLKKFFENDGLHLNSKGYAVWKEVILQKLK